MSEISLFHSHPVKSGRVGFWRLLAVIVVVVLVVAAWMVYSRELALQHAIPAVQQFHDRFNAREFEIIYADATGSFLPSGESREAFQHLRDVTGAVKSSQIRSLSENISTRGSALTATFATVFERGTATELFKWVEGASLKLDSYHVRGRSAEGHAGKVPGDLLDVK